MFERTLFKFYCNALLLSMGSTSIGCSQMEFEGYSASNASAASADTEDNGDEADTPESISGAFLVCGPANTADVPELFGDRSAIGCRAVIDDSYTLQPCSDWNTIRVTYEDGSSENIKPYLAMQHPFWQFFAPVQNNRKISQLRMTATCVGHTTALAAQKMDYQADPSKKVAANKVNPAPDSEVAVTPMAENSPAPPAQAHLIFVTEKRFPANLRYEGFDRECQTAATAAGLSNTRAQFLALISGFYRANQATKRLASGARVINTRGETINPEGSDIWTQGVQMPIAYDEHKNPLSSTDGLVWTGAESNGIQPRLTDRSCAVSMTNLSSPGAWDNYTGTKSAWVGNAKQSGPAWFHMQGTQHPCNRTAHLYCISAKPLP